MKERPILFSSPMVRALLDGTKTQTRRIIKPQPRSNGYMSGGNLLCLNDYLAPDQLVTPEGEQIQCKFGTYGDRLWVRETWAQPFAKMHADSTGSAAGCLYRADDDGRQINPGSMNGRWKPSIHMPRWASRLSLEITDVRVQRLQDISEEDAESEGVESKSIYAGQGVPGEWLNAPETFITPYRELWNTINGRGSWDLNPWVWALTFKRVTP